jgi:hypothetical protein
VEDGDIRDISNSVTTDTGRTWSEPRVAVRDEWRISGCPHVGPSLAAAGSKVYLAWMTAGARRRGIFLAVSQDSGRSFGQPLTISEGIHGATHPFLVSNGTVAAVVFQGSPAKLEPGSSAPSAHAGHAASAGSDAFLRSIRPNGSPGRLLRIPNRGGSISYPFAAISEAGEIAVSWTEVDDEQPSAWIARGKFPALAERREKPVERTGR